MPIFHYEEPRLFGEMVGFKAGPKTLPNQPTKSCFARRKRGAPSMVRISKGHRRQFEGTAPVGSRTSEASKYIMGIIDRSPLGENEDSYPI